MHPRLHASRRNFLRQAGTIAVASMPVSKQFAKAALLELPTNDTPIQDARASISFIANRAPLQSSSFYLLPLGSVRPAGWLRDQLQIQADGLSGHLDETWPDVGPNSGWLGGAGDSWERGPYFLDGLVPLAYLLDDPRLKSKAQKYIDWTLTHQALDGMIGPAANNDWWPRMVMLKVLEQYQEATGDARVIPLLSRYFAHQLEALPPRPLRDWGKFRWQDNALAVLWLYNRTGDATLLDLVRLLHQQGHDWQAQYADFKFTQPITPEFIKLNEGQGLGEVALSTHGVNNGQAIKAASVWWLVSGQAADRDGVRTMLAALDKYHGLPNGMFSCDEHFAGRNPSQGSELCTVVETMFSLEQSLAILGDASLGDRLEKIAFNALPGTLTDDMWAHQYNQEPNQVECSLHHKPWTTDGPESNLFGLEPNFGCCTANFNQGWPKFAASLWMASADNGLAAAAYSPCKVDTIVGRTRVRLLEETDYPFRGKVKITIDPAAPLRFPLKLRIPSWAASSALRMNGRSQPAPEAGRFATIERTWKSGDVVELDFGVRPRLIRGFNDSISIERGPLVLSYPIGESWVKLRDRGMTADWQVFPASAWNYALAVNEGDVGQLPTSESPVGATPFALQATAIKVEVEARQLPSWRAVDGVADPVPMSPVSSDEPLQKITLVPYASAKLRVTAFPQLKGS
jgi:uncharacterized protein